MSSTQCMTVAERNRARGNALRDMDQAHRGGNFVK